MKNRITKKHIYHGLSVALLSASLLLAVFRFTPATLRVVQAFKDFGLSVGFYFTELLGFEDAVTPTVTEIPHGITSVLPVEPSEFKLQMQTFGRLLIDKINAQMYFLRLGRVISGAAKVILIAVLPAALLVAVIAMAYQGINNDYNRDTRPLRIWKRIEDALYYPVKRFVWGFIKFVKDHPNYWRLGLAVWLYNLNVITIGVEALAYVFYFPFSIPKIRLYTQVAKLAIDLTLPIGFLPWWAWAVIGWVIFDRVRKGLGLKKLESGESKNRAFLESHPGALFLTGKQRAKKTTIITDMALSQAAMFREKAKEKLQARDLQFPAFPWVHLELVINYGIDHGSLPTLAKVRTYIRSLKRYFYDFAQLDDWKKYRLLKHWRRWYNYRSDVYLFGENYNMDLWKAFRHECGCSRREFIFGYDYERYGLEYNDNLGPVNIFEAIEKYAQLYFIYASPTPLILANYAIRTDTQRIDNGNFPLFNDDFFNRDPMEINPEYCHVIDFNAVRLGKVTDEKDPYKDGLEIGVVNVMEMAKERGNQHTNAGKKATDEECNQRNDLFELDVKMHGHAATVDNYTFFRMLLDDQRPDSLAADDKDLCDVVMIKTVSDAKIVMPFFAVEEAVYLLATRIFEKIYYKIRNLRGDNTLLIYLLKKLYSPIYNHYVRTFNRYSVYTATVRVSDELTKEIISDRGKYFISTKKVYSYRFATDAINEFYHRKVQRSKYGLNDFARYADLHPSCEDMQSTQSHFYKEIFQRFEVENIPEAWRDRYRKMAGVRYVWQNKNRKIQTDAGGRVSLIRPAGGGEKVSEPAESIYPN